VNDFSQGKGAKAAPNWKVLGLGSSGHTWTSKPAQAFADGIGFAFGSGNPDTKAVPRQRPPRRPHRQAVANGQEARRDGVCTGVCTRRALATSRARLTRSTKPSRHS
jgi:hypothetical protein